MEEAECRESRDTKTPSLVILGGGQLARMLAMAAMPLDCRVYCVEREADCPAGWLAPVAMVPSWEDAGAVVRALEGCGNAVVTLENEFIPDGTLAALEERGWRVWPGSATMRQIRDKLLQKSVLAGAGLPVPAFAEVQAPEDVHGRAEAWGWPVVLKARCYGYDGKGNATVRGPGEVESAWRRLGGAEGRSLYLEAFCPFERELAVQVTRAADGRCVVYPVVETIQRDHICHEVLAPADLVVAVSQRAAELAQEAVRCVGGVGTFGVELFLGRGGQLWINELAPRVHNSGHYTIEACECSQFENHVRAVLGWPLGSTAMRVPAAVMVNLLGRRTGSGRVTGVEKALAIPGAHVHLYGKSRCAPGRKMGHVTALGATVAEARARAVEAAQCIEFGEMCEVI
jgi:5-(carboxyamino)imidazole ribonucleotide synthase